MHKNDLLEACHSILTKEADVVLPIKSEPYITWVLATLERVIFIFAKIWLLISFQIFSFNRLLPHLAKQHAMSTKNDFLKMLYIQIIMARWMMFIEFLWIKNQMSRNSQIPTQNEVLAIGEWGNIRLAKFIALRIDNIEHDKKISNLYFLVREGILSYRWIKTTGTKEVDRVALNYPEQIPP